MESSRSCTNRGKSHVMTFQIKICISMNKQNGKSFQTIYCLNLNNLILHKKISQETNAKWYH